MKQKSILAVSMIILVLLVLAGFLINNISENSNIQPENKNYFFDDKTREELCERNVTGPEGIPVTINMIDDDCLSIISKIYNNSEVCFRIKSSQTKDKCIWDIAVILLDKSLCDQIVGPHQGCYYEIAFKNKEDGACEMLPIKSEKEMCYYQYGISLTNDSYCPKSGISETACYTQVAIKLNSASVCNKISDLSSRYSCLNRI